MPTQETYNMKATARLNSSQSLLTEFQTIKPAPANVPSISPTTENRPNHCSAAVEPIAPDTSGHRDAVPEKTPPKSATANASEMTRTLNGQLNHDLRHQGL